MTIKKITTLYLICQYSILLIIFSSISVFAAQTDQKITIYTEYTDSTKNAYAASSQSLVTWLNSQGFAATQGGQYYPGNSKTAWQYFQESNSTLASQCSTLPVIVINIGSNTGNGLDTILCDFTESTKTSIINAMHGTTNSDTTTGTNSTAPATTTGTPTSTPATTSGSTPTTASSTDTNTPATSSTSANTDNSLKNPFENMGVNVPKDGDLLHMVGPLLVRVINLIITLAGIISVLMIVISGYNLISSAGNQEAIQKGKNGLTYAISGLAITLLAGIIMWSIQSILGLTI